jgi:hypothetical protein
MTLLGELTQGSCRGFPFEQASQRHHVEVMDFFHPVLLREASPFLPIAGKIRH